MSAQPQHEEQPVPRKRLTLKEAATRVGVSTATIRRRIKDGSLRAYQTMGKFGSQWVISPTDLETVTFIPGESLLDLDEPDEGEDPEAASPSVTPDQAPSNGYGSVCDQEEHSEPNSESPEVSVMPARGPSLEQQALHQAGYWKGRWEEARERTMELERQLQSLPLAQLSEQAESNRIAAQQAVSEVERLKAELAQLGEEKAQLQGQLQQSESTLTDLRKSWWQRLFRG
jgi:excisionase family DNA binding protein